MAILGRLSGESLRLSQVAGKLDITVAEASRHLQRLSDTGLIQKDADGRYGVTPYGSLVLSLVPGLDFASQNRAYFAEHSTLALPPKFRNRIGELSSGKHLKDTMATFGNIQEVLKDAEEFAFSMHNTPIPLDNDPLFHKIDSRSILQEGMPIGEGWRLLEGVTRRFLKKVEVFLLVTEKKAIFGLPYLNGNIDYCAFIGKDPSFRGWCSDLFLYFWEEAKPNPSISD